MAYIDVTSDDDRVTVRHNALADKVVIRIGYLGSIVLRDRDEMHDLIGQLQAAAREQVAHQGRELVRNEDEVRTNAEVREAL